MKRTISLLLTVVLLLSITACSGSGSTEPTVDSTSTSVTEVTEIPTTAPTIAPTGVPTSAPATVPTKAPTTAATTVPATASTKAPTTAPATKPATTATQKSTVASAPVPTKAPETKPVTIPTEAPTTATAKICDHSKTEWVIDKDATCIAEGIKRKVCTQCKKDLEKAVIDKSAHSYSNYKCTVCGEFQKDGLSGYLSDWVQKNGKVNGETVSLDFYIDDILYGLTYNATGDYFFFSLLDENYNDFLSLKFTETAGIYELAYIQGTEPNTREVYGKIDASKFTENTPITVEEYLGNSDGRPGAVENCRICTGLLLDAIGTAFEKYNVGLTLNNLGFLKLS